MGLRGVTGRYAPYDVTVTVLEGYQNVTPGRYPRVPH